MANQNSGNLSKSDILSFVALLLMGVFVFFGMNFKTLGDKVPSLAVSILLVVLMTLFIFLAAYAKGQDRYQDMWKKVEWAMLALYVAALAPCYVYVSKFCEVQFGRADIVSQVQADVDGIDRMFADYKRMCDARSGSYQTALEALSKDKQGRVRIAQTLGIGVGDVTPANIRQASESFLNSLRGAEFKALEAEKGQMEAMVKENFKKWNLMLVPQAAQELGAAKAKYAQTLQDLYSKHQNKFETEVPEFSAAKYASEVNVADRFSTISGITPMGLLVVLVLGGLGFLKYVFAAKRTVLSLKKGDSSSITSDGGIAF